MSSNNDQLPSAAAQSQRYAAAESMLQHSRMPRNDSTGLHGYMLPENQIQLDPHSQLSQMAAVPISPQTGFVPHHYNATTDQNYGYEGAIEGVVNSPSEIKGPFGQGERSSFSGRSEGPGSNTSAREHRGSVGSAGRSGASKRKESLDGSDPISPASSRGFTTRGSTGREAQGSSNDHGMVDFDDQDDSKPPSWSELKTKAGKERKRLPLACIACRRKKIRCSGEKPACKHCLRSRIPCVYKVTARKAAPRTDYMAMLDKRLKRMEERVIKIIPKEEMATAAAIGRANVRPPTSGHNLKAQSGRKRVAGEAFGPDTEEWAHSKTARRPPRVLDPSENRLLMEGADKLPAPEIQEHLSEVFFECLSGQAYHLLHKPSFMRKLRAGTVHPVLILAVCAIAARFSTHPHVSSEPAFLRGESWAAPAREIVLKRYDEPNLTILTVLLILGLHEFGTCQGGRSWMLGGMAMRMAYALQLHRELDHDPTARDNTKAPELSSTDREIRRRTMWACFLMDRFNSSGTERPTFISKDNIRIQLPIKESHFQMEIPGSTEALNGEILNPIPPDTGQVANARDNMGVAAYLVRIIATWGCVIEYLNLGGKEKDACAMSDLSSKFAQLRRKVDDFESSLPPSLQNRQDNLNNHAAEKTANQFLFMHIATNQARLFLHRFAIPSSPGGKPPKDVPRAFVAEAGSIAIEAANRISVLLESAVDHQVVAPFAGYCAFSSSTVHIWGIFSKNAGLEASSKRNLARNVKYLSKMKKYWGMFHFMAENLKDIYRAHADASIKGPSTGETNTQDPNIFQYGDWFQKYPHGVSSTDYEDPATKIKQESNDAALSQKSDLQSVEEFFHQLSPTAKGPHHRKSTKRSSKPHPSTLQSSQPLHHQPQVLCPIDSHQSLLPHQHPLPSSHPPISPVSFPTPQHQLYNHAQVFTPSSYPLLSPLQLSPLQHTKLDPSSTLVYDDHGGPARTTSVWDAAPSLDYPQHTMQNHYVGGGLQQETWYMPFNLNPPEMEGEEYGAVGHGGFGGEGGVGGLGGQG